MSPTPSVTFTFSASPSSTPTPSPTPTRTPTRSVPPTAAVDRCATPGVICTVAGNGNSLFDGDGKPATETSLYFPFSITFDAQGRPLILDWNNLRLRRINADGRIQTIMGNDTEAFPVEGALAKDTSLHHSSDLCFDGAGRMYLAGHHIPIVFRVDLDQSVRTIAGTQTVGYSGDGGPALQAQMGVPYGIVARDDGSFLVSDSQFHVVRSVDAGGTIRTMAGTGTAGFSGDLGPASLAQLHEPRRLRLASDGSLYVCDSGNHVIRRIATDGIITTIAGIGAALGYDGDGGLATEAHLDTPTDLRLAPNGDMYIADSGNNVIRRIDAEGIISTVVGTGDPGFRGDTRDASFAQMRSPYGITLADDGSLWIADTFNHRIRRIAGFLGLAR